MQILTEKQEDVLKAERQVLNDLRIALIQFGADDQDSQILAESITLLDELFLLVVVGELNAGKSAFINALLGQKLLVEGVTPTTTQINLLRYGVEQKRDVVDENHHILSLPIDWLSELTIVDTPGTNAIIRAHETITTQFVPRSDLVLFITSSDRPFTESERAFMEHIREWGKKVVIIINKIDLLEQATDIQQIIHFVSENALLLLGITPEIFPVSWSDSTRFSSTCVSATSCAFRETDRRSLRATSKKRNRWDSGILSWTTSKDASCLDGRRASPSIFFIVLIEQ